MIHTMRGAGYVLKPDESSPAVPHARRLVLTAVSLVALVSLLVGIATTLAMRSYLINQLDNEVAAALDRASHAGGDRGGAPPSLPPIDRDGDGDEFRVIRGQAGRHPDGRCSTRSTDRAEVLTSTGDEGARLRGAGRARRRTRRPARATPSSSRASATTASPRCAPSDGVVVTGLPTDDVDEPDRQPDLARAAAHPGRGRRRGHHRLRGRTPPAAAAARGGRHRPRGQHAAAVRGRDRPVAAGARPAHRRGDRGRPGRLPPSTRCSSHVETSLSARHASELQVRQFVADASHELRTPLATIKGYAELSRRRPDDAEALLGRPRQGRVRGRADVLAGRRPAAARPPRRRAGRWSASPWTSPTCCSRPSPTPGSLGPGPPLAAGAARGGGRGGRRRGRGCTRWSPTCSATPAGTPRPAPPSRSGSPPRSATGSPG